MRKLQATNFVRRQQVPSQMVCAISFRRCVDWSSIETLEKRPKRGAAPALRTGHALVAARRPEPPKRRLRPSGDDRCRGSLARVRGNYDRHLCGTYLCGDDNETLRCHRDRAGTHHEAGTWSASRIRPRWAWGKGGSARQTHDPEPLQFLLTAKMQKPNAVE